MKSALSELKMQGYENIFLWVLEQNVRGRCFYEQLGFSPTDDFINDNIGGKELREVRYVYKYLRRYIHERNDRILWVGL